MQEKWNLANFTSLRTRAGRATTRRMGKSHLSGFTQDNHYTISNLTNKFQKIESQMGVSVLDLFEALKTSGKSSFDKHFKCDFF